MYVSRLLWNTLLELLQLSKLSTTFCSSTETILDKSKLSKCFRQYKFVNHYGIFYFLLGTSWSWSYGSWIYIYLCNQCLSSLMLWVRILLRRGVLDTTLCNKVCQWLAASWWFYPGAPFSFTNKTDHDISEILLKLALNTLTLTLISL